MAHLPEDNLPGEFDVIIDGTGLIQSLLAASLARVGKSVLHLDKNPYYGDTWANLMYRDLEPWVRGEVEEVRVVDVKEGGLELKEGEKVVSLNIKDIPPSCSNVQCSVCEYAAVPVPSQGDSPKPEGGGAVEEQPQTGKEEGEPGESNGDPQASAPVGGEEGGGAAAKTDVPAEGEEAVTWSSLGRRVRQLCIDFSPKMVLARGAMVDVLVRSDVARYLEFQAVKRLLSPRQGKMEPVPCSRADLFSTKEVSMPEKRKMMKFLTFCAEFEKHPEEYEGLGELSFEDFLKSRGLTPNLVQFIIYSIASVPGDVPFREGLKATQTFLQSLGRYGNTPYIFPLYGSGDVNQGFCRYAAVYQGIYCLNRSLQAIVVEQEEGKCTGVVCTSSQPIRCSHLITGPRLLSIAMDTSSFATSLKVSRAVLLTDRSLKQDESPGTSILSIPPRSLGEEQIPVITGMELDASTCCCPVGTYLLHLSCTSNALTAKEDLYPFVETFLTTPEKQQGEVESPRLLWSLFYNQEWVTIDQQQYCGDANPLPPNVHLVSDPDLSVAYTASIDEAKFIFQQMYPEEEFFPQPAPQPQLEEEELPPQQQPEGEGEGVERAQEGHKDDDDGGEVEGGNLAAEAAVETVNAAEASN